MYIYHIFLIQPSVNGHLGCFHVLAIVNSAVMNIRVCVSFLKKVFSGYIPKSGIAGSYGSSMWFSNAPPYCSLWWLHQLTFPPAEQKGSLFSAHSPTFGICGHVNDGHSDWCEVVPHSSFDLHFSNNYQS